MTLVRKINLVEILKEELEAEGLNLPADLTNEQLEAWTEDQVRQYYTTNGQTGAAASSPPAAPTGTQAHCHTHLHKQQLHLAEDQLQRLKLTHSVQPDPAAAKACFPGLGLSRTDVANPTAVVLCFHSSGTAEDMYTSEGTGSRRAPSPLLEACRLHGWKLLAAQLPGRGLRAKETPLPTLQEVAKQLLPLVAPELLAANGKYAVIGHSMGCWAAYELVMLLLQEGFPQPRVACFAAMPWPHIPMEQRPWNQQKTLSEAQFKDECRAWDISEVVFSEGMWEMYQPMLRADFRLFDEYINTHPGECTAAYQHAGQPPFTFPLRLFWGRHDKRVTQGMVQEWSSYTSAACEVSCVDGNHLFPLQPAAKAQWLEEVAKALAAKLPVCGEGSKVHDCANRP